MQTINRDQTQQAPASMHWSWGDLLHIFLVSFILYVVGLVLLAFLLPTQALYNVGAALVEAGVLVGSVYWLGLRRRRQSWTAIGIVTTSWRWLLGAVGLGLLFHFIGGWVVYGMQALLGQPNVNPQQDLLTPSGLSWVSIIGTILFAGVVIPFAEELFFRGMLYRFLRERWGVGIGAIGSALVFGAAHLNLGVGLAMCILGLVCALVYERTRSLWPSIIIHAVNNCLAFILTYALLATHTWIPLV